MHRAVMLFFMVCVLLNLTVVLVWNQLSVTLRRQT